MENKAEFKTSVDNFVRELISFAQESPPTFLTLHPFLEERIKILNDKFRFESTDQLEMAKEFLIFSKALSILKLSCIVDKLSVPKIKKLQLKDLWLEKVGDLLSVTTAYKKELDGK